MNELFDQAIDDAKNRAWPSREGIRPVPRVTPTDSPPSDRHGPGSFDLLSSAFHGQQFAMIAAYSLGILVALGYVPGLGL